MKYSINLSDVETGKATRSKDGTVSYRFTFPMFEDTTVPQLLGLLLAGYNLSMTFPDGSKKKLALVDIPTPDAKA